MASVDQLRITHLLELSMIQMDRDCAFTDVEQAEILYLTTYVNKKLKVKHAIEIQEAGLTTKYGINQNVRQLVDIWCEYPDTYAGLSLTDFIEKVNG